MKKMLPRTTKETPGCQKKGTQNQRRTSLKNNQDSELKLDTEKISTELVPSFQGLALLPRAKLVCEACGGFGQMMSSQYLVLKTGARGAQFVSPNDIIQSRRVNRA